MAKPPSFRGIKDEAAAQLARLGVPPGAATAGGLVIRPQAAEEQRIADENNGAQASLDCLANCQQDEAGLFATLLSSAVVKHGLAYAVAEEGVGGSGLTAEDILHIEDMAETINIRRQTKKWEQVAQALAEIGITKTGKGQRHMVWAAKRFGVDLVPLPPAPPTIVEDRETIERERTEDPAPAGEPPTDGPKLVTP